MSLVLNVEILGEFRKLTEATSGAQTQLKTLQKTATNISSKINSAFAAIGLGLSLSAVINGLQAAGKAAVADVKSQELLANTMRKSAGATDDQIASVEAYLAKMQLSTSIADDDLRPAYQKLFLATGSVTKANDLLAIALDVSAGSGKDLDTVAQGMAKSLAGSNGALGKLVPSVKDSKTPIEDLAKAFDGAAVKAANLDPYQRMNIIFGDIQEKIGMGLMPALNNLSTWLSTPEGQEKLQELVNFAIDLTTKFTDFVNFVLDNKETILGWAGVIGAVGLAIKGVNGAITIFNGLKTIFEVTGSVISKGLQGVGLSAEIADTKVRNLGLAFGWISAVAAGLALIVSLNEKLGLGTNEGAARTWGTTPTGGATNFSGNSSIPLTGSAGSFTNMAPISSGRVNSNVTVNINTPKVTATDIINTINKYKTNGGTANYNSAVTR